MEIRRAEEKEGQTTRGRRCGWPKEIGANANRAKAIEPKSASKEIRHILAPLATRGSFFDTRLARNPPRRLLFPYVTAKTRRASSATRKDTPNAYDRDRKSTRLNSSHLVI